MFSNQSEGAAATRRVRLVFDEEFARVLPDFETRFIFLIPSKARIVSDVLHSICERFDLTESKVGSNGIALQIDGFSVPPSEDASCLFVNDTISVKKRRVKKRWLPISASQQSQSKKRRISEKKPQKSPLSTKKRKLQKPKKRIVKLAAPLLLLSEKSEDSGYESSSSSAASSSSSSSSSSDSDSKESESSSESDSEELDESDTSSSESFTSSSIPSKVVSTPAVKPSKAKPAAPKKHQPPPHISPTSDGGSGEPDRKRRKQKQKQKQKDGASLGEPLNLKTSALSASHVVFGKEGAERAQGERLELNLGPSSGVPSRRKLQQYTKHKHKTTHPSNKTFGDENGGTTRRRGIENEDEGKGGEEEEQMFGEQEKWMRKNRGIQMQPGVFQELDNFFAPRHQSQYQHGFENEEAKSYDDAPFLEADLRPGDIIAYKTDVLVAWTPVRSPYKEAEILSFDPHTKLTRYKRLPPDSYDYSDMEQVVEVERNLLFDVKIIKSAPKLSETPKNQRIVFSQQTNGTSQTELKELAPSNQQTSGAAGEGGGLLKHLAERKVSTHEQTQTRPPTPSAVTPSPSTVTSSPSAVTPSPSTVTSSPVTPLSTTIQSSHVAPSTVVVTSPSVVPSSLVSPSPLHVSSVEPLSSAAPSQPSLSSSVASPSTVSPSSTTITPSVSLLDPELSRLIKERKRRIKRRETQKKKRLKGKLRRQLQLQQAADS